MLPRLKQASETARQRALRYAKAERLAKGTSRSVRDITRETGVPRKTVKEYRAHKISGVPEAGRPRTYFPKDSWLPLGAEERARAHGGNPDTVVEQRRAALRARKGLIEEGDFEPGGSTFTLKGAGRALHRELKQANREMSPIVTRTVKATDDHHIGVTREQMLAWFANVAKPVLDDVNGAPHYCLMSGDETGVVDATSGKGWKVRIRVPVGSKATLIPSTLRITGKRHVTIWVLGSVGGSCQVSYYIAGDVSAAVSTAILSECPEAHICGTPKGSTDKQIFEDEMKRYVETTGRWLDSLSGKRPWRAVFTDSHGSRDMDEDFVKWLRRERVHVVTYLAGTSMTNAPQDLNLNREVKGKVEELVGERSATHPSEPMDMPTMCRLVAKAVRLACTPTVLSAGFRNAGLDPYDPGQVVNNPKWTLLFSQKPSSAETKRRASKADSLRRTRQLLRMPVKPVDDTRGEVAPPPALAPSVGMFKLAGQRLTAHTIPLMRQLSDVQNELRNLTRELLNAKLLEKDGSGCVTCRKSCGLCANVLVCSPGLRRVAPKRRFPGSRKRALTFLQQSKLDHVDVLQKHIVALERIAKESLAAVETPVLPERPVLKRRTPPRKRTKKNSPASKSATRHSRRQPTPPDSDEDVSMVSADETTAVPVPDRKLRTQEERKPSDAVAGKVWGSGLTASSSDESSG